jgi:hypothetical protein
MHLGSEEFPNIFTPSEDFVIYGTISKPEKNRSSVRKK